MKFLLQFPFLISISIVSAVSMIVFLVILKAIRKRIPHELLKENHDVASYLYNAICFIYAVLIAFVVYATWHSLMETTTIIEQEANHLLDLYYEASAFPDPVKKDIEAAIRDYVIKVTQEEWESMSEGKRSYDAAKIFGRLNKIFISIDASNMPNCYVLQESLANLNKVGEYRRLRLLKSRQNIPDIIWTVLILCSTVMIFFTFFFGTKNVRRQFFMTSILIFISVLVLYLIYVLDHPFIGQYRITTEAFEPILSYIRDYG